MGYFGRGLTNVPRQCGGCNTLMVGTGTGDMWINPIGSFALCSKCIALIRTTLPMLNTNIRIKVADDSYYRATVFEEERKKNAKKQKFILQRRPKR